MDKQLADTLLSYVISGGIQGIITTLLDAGADINIKDEDGCTILMRVLWSDIDFDDKYIALETLIKNGADVNAQDNTGCSVLMCAVKEDLIDMVELLLDNGAEKDIEDKDGWTALKIADESGYRDISNLLRGLTRCDLHEERIRKGYKYAISSNKGYQNKTM